MLRPPVERVFNSGEGRVEFLQSSPFFDGKLGYGKYYIF